MEFNINTGKKRLTKEEFNNLPDENKKKFKFQLFDEEFGVGFGDDICFTYRVLLKGLTIQQTTFSVDHHRFGKHVNDEKSDKIKQVMANNAFYFKKKWNLIKEEKNE